MKSNVLIVHGGAPTAVINSSLFGAVTEAKKYGDIDKVYAAMGGSKGILDENFLDLKSIDEKNMEMLLQTPASAIGTSRYELKASDYEKMAQIIKRNNIKYVLFNGGNGTMDTCGKIYGALGDSGINVVGIPKTIDNDISITDHSPGFGSAARYIAETVNEIAQDVKALPIHVCVIEALGRNAGWITAASALARKKEGDAPHLIYLPERPFDEEEFLDDVKKLYDKLGGVVVVVSEGLKNKDGKPIVEPIFEVGRSVYYGDVSSHLSNLVIKSLGIKARSEKPGICGRASAAFQSTVDRDEAVLAGSTAMKAAYEGNTGVMVGFERIPGKEYQIKTILIPISEVMLHERVMPENYINERGNDVTKEYIEWCRPLIGQGVREFVSFL